MHYALCYTNAPAEHHVQKIRKVADNAFEIRSIVGQTPEMRDIWGWVKWSRND